MEERNQQQSALPLVLMVGLLAIIGVVVVLGGIFFAGPFVGAQHHQSSFSYGISYGCSGTNQDCAITITNNPESNGSMTVSATSSTPAGATFSPATITITPGNQAQIAVKPPTGTCLTAINLLITTPMHANSDMPIQMPPCAGTPAAHAPTPKP